MARSQFEEALLTHKSLVLGWMRDFSQQSNVNVHELSGGLHTGGLSDAQAPQFLKVDGSRQLSGNLSVLDGVTIDGVDLSAHAASVNAHHEPVTILDTATIDLSLSGQQISGSVIQSALDHGSIGGLGDDDHTQYFNTTRHTLLVHTNLGLTPNTRQIISGNGLSGGGDLSADRTLAVGAGTGISVGADSVGIDLAANLTWTGNHVFQGGLSTRHLLPELTDTYDLGSSVLLWRKGWLSELDTVLFAQNSVTLLGGWLLISKDEGALVGDVLAADTTIDFGKSMTVGDFVLMRASLKMEYMQVGALISGTTYNVTRNLDGSGANDWAGGTPFAVLGTTGNGRIELNAYDTPRISILEQGSTYNAQTERIRIGDLVNWQSAGFSGYGIAIGNYSGGESLVYSPTGGLEVRGTIKADDGYLQNLTVQGLLNLSTSGELRAGTTTNGLRFGYLSDGYYLRGIGGGTTQVEIRASDGKLYAGGGKVIIDGEGIKFGKYLTEFMGLLDHRGINLSAVDMTSDPSGMLPNETGSNINWLNSSNYLQTEIPVAAKIQSKVYYYGGLSSQLYTTIKGDLSSVYEVKAQKVSDINYNTVIAEGKMQLTYSHANFLVRQFYSGAPTKVFEYGLNMEGDRTVRLVGEKISFEGAMPTWSSISLGLYNYEVGAYTPLTTTSFKVSGLILDHSYTFLPGTRLRIVQNTTKYFYVTSSSYSSATQETTVNVTGIGGSAISTSEAIYNVFINYGGVAKGLPGASTYVPLTTPILVTNSTTEGTFHYTTTSYGIPSGAKAVSLYSGGRWSTANNAYFNAAFYYNSTSIAFASYNAVAANMNGTFNAMVPLDSSGRFTHKMVGNMVVQYIYITGYWI